MSYVENPKSKAYIMVYNNMLVNDLHKLGFHCLVKPDLDKLNDIAQWIDKNLIEIIVVKRVNEVDHLGQIKKKKLHYVVTYDDLHFPPQKTEELRIELQHRERNFVKNYLKRKKAEKIWEDDAEIIENQE